MSRRNAVPRLSAVAAMAVTLFALAAPASASRILWDRGIGYYTWTGGLDYDRAGDFNGDGFEDFILSYPVDNTVLGETGTLGKIHVFLGAPYEEPFQEIVFSGTQPYDYLGGQVSHVGDLDGDGFDDILAVRRRGPQQQVIVFRGGADSDAIVDLVIPWPGTGIFIGAAGDLNADGYDDFAVSEPANSANVPNAGRVYIFFGGPVLDGTPDLVLHGQSADDAFGRAFAGERDVNGDGFTDFVVGSPGSDASGLPDAGEVLVFHGGPGLDDVPDTILLGATAMAQFGISLDLLADFDGDGDGDIVVGEGDYFTADHRIFVFRGGPGSDTIPDWTVAAGPGVAAGDDVNRDHFSDVLVQFSAGRHAYFGGSPPDTILDSPLSYWPSYFELPSGTAKSAGDVNGDGYQDWLAVNSTGGVHGSALLSLFTARSSYRFASIGPAVGGSPVMLEWDGSEVANVLYTRGDGSWQTVATGVGGAAQNSAAVVLPPGRTDHARLRLAAVANDSSWATSPQFKVHDLVDVDCLAAQAKPGGIAVNWQGNWLGYPGAVPRYRLYRRDPGGSEARIGPDPIVEEGWMDSAGASMSHYRLAAIRPDESEVMLDSVAVGSSLCESTGTRWWFWAISDHSTPFIVLFDSSSPRPTDVLLSEDGGVNWRIVAEDVSPASTSVEVSSGAPTLVARLRSRLRGVGGTIWGDSFTFWMNADLMLRELRATAVADGGTLIEWNVGTKYKDGVLSTTTIYPVTPGMLGLVGYQLCRPDPSSACPGLLTTPSTGTSYFDPTGTLQSQYTLSAVVTTGETVPLGTVSVTPGEPPGSADSKMRVSPSPARRVDSITMTIPGLLGQAGAVNDVIAQVLDVSGREVTRLAQGFGPGAGIFQWVPAQHGAHSGIYFLRVRSSAAGFDRTVKFVVVS